MDAHAQNPYVAPTAVADNPGATEARGADPRSRFTRFAHCVLRPSVFLSIFAVTHFGGSLAFWSVGGLLIFQLGPNVAAWMTLIWAAAPALLLFGLSVINLIRSIWRKRFATITVIFIYLIGACLFWYDIVNERCQIQVGIATAEYWENGGQKNTYFTWWWFNDGWFR